MILLRCNEGSGTADDKSQCGTANIIDNKNNITTAKMLRRGVRNNGGNYQWAHYHR